MHRGLIIIGAGPAGMAAAITAAENGLRPLLIDEQAGPGGQIYRSVESPAVLDRSILGNDYWHGEQPVRQLRRLDIEYWPATTVWQITSKREIAVIRDGVITLLRAQRVIIATGAQERPFPIPGWTLPGVMAAGAGQILLKSSGLVPEDPYVIAGSGPLVYLLAAQYVRAGAAPHAILDTSSRSNYRQAMRHLPAALRAPHYLAKGARLLLTLRQAGVRHIRGVKALRASGQDHIEQIEYQYRGEKLSVPCTTLFLHDGVVPNVQMTRALRCDHIWDERQYAWHPRIDKWFNTTVEGIGVAGDGAGIVGAHASKLAGQLAALEALCALGLITKGNRDTTAQPIRHQYERHCRARPFLDLLYRPAGRWDRTLDETVVCRCEEITAGEVRQVAALGCIGPNQAKIFTRAGMGPCQGRMCGLTVSKILADATDRPLEMIGYYRIRSPVKPITLAQLASVSESHIERG